MYAPPKTEAWAIRERICRLPGTKHPDKMGKAPDTKIIHTTATRTIKRDSQNNFTTGTTLVYFQVVLDSRYNVAHLVFPDVVALPVEVEGKNVTLLRCALSRNHVEDSGDLLVL